MSKCWRTFVGVLCAFVVAGYFGGTNILVEARDYSEMKVVQLRRELRVRGLNRKGSRADLIERLKAAENSNSVPENATVTKQSVGPSKRQQRHQAMGLVEGPCNPNPCNYGLCAVVDNNKQVAYSCVCSQQWFGVHCNQSRVLEQHLKSIEKELQREHDDRVRAHQDKLAAAQAQQATDALISARQKLSWLKYKVWYKKHNRKSLESGHILSFDELPNVLQDDLGRFVVTNTDGQELISFSPSQILQISPSLGRAQASNTPRGKQQISVWLSKPNKRKRAAFVAEKVPHAFDLVFKSGKAQLSEWLDLVGAVLGADAPHKLVSFPFLDKEQASIKEKRVRKSAADDARKRRLAEEERRAELAHLAEAAKVKARLDEEKRQEEKNREREEHKLKNLLQKEVRKYRRAIVENQPDAKSQSLTTLQTLRGRIRVHEMTSDKKIVETVDTILKDNNLGETEAARVARQRAQEGRQLEEKTRRNSSRLIQMMPVEERETLIKQLILAECPTFLPSKVDIDSLNATLQRKVQQFRHESFDANRSVKESLARAVHEAFSQVWEVQILQSGCQNKSDEKDRPNDPALAVPVAVQTPAENVDVHHHAQNVDASARVETTGVTDSPGESSEGRHLSPLPLPLPVLPTASDENDELINGGHAVHPRVVVKILEDLHAALRTNNFPAIDFALDRAESARMHPRLYPILSEAQSKMSNHLKETAALLEFRSKVADYLEGRSDVKLASRQKLLNMSNPIHKREWLWAQTAVANHFLSQREIIHSNNTEELQCRLAPIPRPGENHMPSIRQLELPRQKQQVQERKEILTLEQSQLQTKIKSKQRDILSFLQAHEPDLAPNIARYFDINRNNPSLAERLDNLDRLWASMRLKYADFDSDGYQAPNGSNHSTNQNKNGMNEINESNSAMTPDSHKNESLEQHTEKTLQADEAVKRRSYIASRLAQQKQQSEILATVSGGRPVFVEGPDGHGVDALEGLTVPLTPSFFAVNRTRMTNKSNKTESTLLTKTMNANADAVKSPLPAKTSSSSFLDKHNDVQILAHANTKPRLAMMTNAQVFTEQKKLVLDETATTTPDSTNLDLETLNRESAAPQGGPSTHSKQQQQQQLLRQHANANADYEASDSQNNAHGIEVHATASPILPNLWRRATAPNGRPYWWHSETKETRWDDPSENARRRDEIKIGAPPEGVWRQASTKEGRVYWWNARTRETSWTRPETVEGVL